MVDYIRCASPLGMLTITAKDNAITAVVLDGQKYAEHHLAPAMRQRVTPVLSEARDWLSRYFAGEKPLASELKLAPDGTDYQRRVWRALLGIPYGETTTYGALARSVGGAAQSVGGAVGRNPILILIPCHRVLGADGSLTGYAAGLENKQKLLELERL